MQIDRADTFMASLRYETYRVGGSVRDEILGRKPKDADYMVRGVKMDRLGAMLLAAVKSQGYEKPGLSPIRLRQGGQFGWRVSGRGLGLIEVALPRTERSTGDGRLMDVTVDPALTLAEDAKRRDFTFNALYQQIVPAGEGQEGGVLGGVVDPTNRGLYDLQHRQINVTHADSFIDDPLRMLRALRFISVLGYDLGAETYALMQAHADAATGLTANGYASGTIYEEFSKLLMGAQPAKALRIARDTGVLAVVMPELAPMLGFDQGSRYHDLTTDEHTFTALETAAHVDAPLRVRWALLFHDSGKPATAWIGQDGRKHYYSTKIELADNGDGIITEDHEVVGESNWLKACNRMTGVPRDLRRDVALLIREHMVPTKTKNVGTRVRRMRVKFGDELLRDLLLHRACDLSGKGLGIVNKNAMQHIAKMEELRSVAEGMKIPMSVKDLKITGGDIAGFGAQGRQIGEIQRRVLDEVICRPDGTTETREWQLSRAEKLAGI